MLVSPHIIGIAAERRTAQPYGLQTGGDACWNALRITRRGSRAFSGLLRLSTRDCHRAALQVQVAGGNQFDAATISVAK
jgi:hypothetical protein